MSGNFSIVFSKLIVKNNIYLPYIELTFPYFGVFRFSFCYCIVRPSSECFWLPLCCLQTFFIHHPYMCILEVNIINNCFGQHIYIVQFVFIIVLIPNNSKTNLEINHWIHVKQIKQKHNKKAVKISSVKAIYGEGI